MRTNQQTTVWLVGACCAAAVQFTAQAGLTQLNLAGYDNYTLTVVANGYSRQVYASAFAATRTGGAALPAPTTDPFVTFCLDLNQGLGNGWWKSGTFSDTSLTGNGGTRLSDGLYRAASLYRQYSAGILAVGSGGSYSWLDMRQGAALQLAIWEVLYQPYDAADTSHHGYDVNSGGASGFEIAAGSQTASNVAMRNLANQYLWSTYNTVDYSLATTFWNAAYPDGTSRSSQDLIGPAAAVPEPTTLLAGALMLLPLAWGSLRGLRRLRAA